MRVLFNIRGVSEIGIFGVSRSTLLLGSLLFALTYQLVDWPTVFQEIYGYPMIDRLVYTQMIDYYNLPIDYTENFGLTTYFTLEFLWNYSLAYLNRDLGMSTEQIFFFITTFVLWRFSYEVARRSGWGYVILLLNPLIVDLAFSQLRIAFAIAVISFFWRGNHGRLTTIAAYVICTSIHTAIVLFAIIHFVANKFNVTNRKGLIVLCATGFLIAAAIGPLREMILGSIGDRRADEYDMSSTPLYLSFWVFLWGMLVFRWRKTMSTIETRYSIIILSIVVCNLLFEGYPTRFIAVALPFLLISMRDYPSKPFSMVTLAFIPYMIIQWMFWLLIL